MINLLLITLGNPEQLTGGYLYQQCMATAAPSHGINMSFASFPGLPFPLPILSTRDIAEAIHEKSPDVILIDSIAAAYMVPLALRGKLQVPLCGLLHQPPGGMEYGPLRTHLQSFLDMVVYRRSARLIVTSQLLATEMQRRKITAERISVVLPGRQPYPDAPDSLRFRSQGEKPLFFLCVANWLPRKGIHLLIDAFALLPPRMGTLHLIGDTQINRKYTDRIMKRIKQSRLENSIHVYGPLPQSAVADLYRTADVFVLPSLVEPYGMVYGEAMSFGLPVVGIKAGNLPNLIEHEREGLLAKPNDVKDLAQNLFRIAGDSQLRTEMGKAASKRASSLPTWEESADAFFAAVKATIV